MNVASWLSRTACLFPDRPAISLGNRVWADYRQLAQRSVRLAGTLRDVLHLAPGDRVALAMRNAPEYLEILYAVWHAGLTAVPINAKLHAREFEFILAHSGSRACFVTPIWPRPSGSSWTAYLPSSAWSRPALRSTRRCSRE